MRTDVLQAVAICCHGNAYFACDDVESAPELLGLNRTFRAVQDCIFERHVAGYHGKNAQTVAAGTAPWLRRLRTEGVERLYLLLENCEFDGEGTDENWGISTDGNFGLEIWNPKWKQKSAFFGENVTWKVTYAGERISRGAWRPPKSPAEASKTLLALIEKAEAFCHDKAPYSMRVPIERCRELQAVGRKDTPGFPDLYPATMGEASQRLCAAALLSMLVICSSMWNAEHLHDPGDSHEFEALTRAIWRASMDAFESATNYEATSSQSRALAG